MTYNHFHEIDSNPETNAHLAEIIESISANGWQGLPLLADGENLLNGCHRATACEILGVTPVVHTIEFGCTWGDDEYTDMLMADFADANDAQSLLNALVALHEEGMVDELSVKIMQAECAKE